LKELLHCKFSTFTPGVNVFFKLLQAFLHVIGKFNKDTGEILWKFELPANSSKDLKLKYSVKYPKNRNVILD
jgi:outer membrane protein assembly factor BamB